MTAKPGEHPYPHADLAARSPLLYTLARGTTVYRLHQAGRNPLYFGKTADNRFDAPDRSFGVLYAGADEYCCFIETCGQSTGNQSVTGAYLDRLHLAEMELVHSISLIDLATSGGLARIGADGRLLTGSHAISQRWSAALRNHPTHPAGIRYLARHDPAKMAFAIFESPSVIFRITSRGSLYEPSNRSLLGKTLDHYQFGLIEP